MIIFKAALLIFILIAFELIFFTRKEWKVDEFLARLISYALVLLVLEVQGESPKEILKASIAALFPILQLIYKSLSTNDEINSHIEKTKKEVELEQAKLQKIKELQKDKSKTANFEAKIASAVDNTTKAKEKQREAIQSNLGASFEHRTYEKFLDLEQINKTENKEVKG